jgi:3-methyl-2-oxobutanoate hydroxymethyltransferase
MTYATHIAFGPIIANKRHNMHAGIARLSSMKARGEKIAVLTAYDYPTARLLDESGIDLLLVGDSVGMVVLGYPDTTLVTLDEMIHHTRAVARGAKQAPIMADLPIATYETPAQSVASAGQLIEAGAHAVKLEGGASHVPQIRTLVAAGIPVMAHIGMQPQRVRLEGGYHMKGKTAEDAERLLADAHAVEDAGSFGLLLELVHPDTAHRITDAIKIPTIGIGAGPNCDGQVLVTHDLIGLFPWFTPKFVAPAANISQQIREATAEYMRRVKGPSPRG